MTLTHDQEIRSIVLEMKRASATAMACACIMSKNTYYGERFWTDGDLEEYCEYITTGKKPVT